MKIIGIICEYNPLHLGHAKQISLIRQSQGADCGIVCLMSGNFVQRGAPAILDKACRARAALACGADLVLELLVQYALSSAEGFAHGGVRILSDFCHGLSFGAERTEGLRETAEALLSVGFSEYLRRELDTGKSFPAARQAALTAMGLDGGILATPNNILAVEYCKAVLAQNSQMELLPILRAGDYHDPVPDASDPSATAVRRRMVIGGDWEAYIPPAAAGIFRNEPLHTLEAGERAVLARLRTMTESEFAALPYGSEGLWRKFMAACRERTTVEEILTAVKSKRYTRTRLDRMLLCAVLGLDRETMARRPEYTRVLAMNDRGREILKQARKSGDFFHAGEKTDSPDWLLEQRCSDLYGLFAVDGPEAPGREPKRRLIYDRITNE